MFQILKLSENILVTLMIHWNIEIFDEKVSSTDSNLNNDQIVQVGARWNQNSPLSTIGSEHVALSSPSPSVSIAKTEQRRMNDLAFTNFHKKIGKAFSNYFNENIRFNVVDQVIDTCFSFF